MDSGTCVAEDFDPAMFLVRIADLLEGLQTEILQLQNDIGERLECGHTRVENLLPLQTLDRQAQIQEDLAAVVNELAAGIRRGNIDPTALAMACRLKSTQDALFSLNSAAPRTDVRLGDVNIF